MNDCPNYDHADYPESRPFNPFGEEEPVEPNDSNETGGGYPAGWPRCPSCGAPAMDGHITCGQAQCNEGAHRP